MTLYLTLGAGAALVSVLVLTAWFSYRAGRTGAQAEASGTGVDAANAVTRTEAAMAQAQVSGPRTEAALLGRLDDGSA